MMKNRKRMRIFAAVLALSLISAPSAALPVSAADPAYLFQDTFESGAGDWTGRGSAKAAVTTDAAYAGKSSLYVTGRTESWHGTIKKLSSDFVAGKAYSFSADVCLASGSDTIALTLQYSDGTTTIYDKIATAEGSADEWVQVANPSYTIPAGASNLQLYVETVSSSGNFYVDEIIAAADGTAIDGPKPVPFIRGDLNADEQINAVDFTLAKQGILSGKFDDTRTKKACDVNQDNRQDLKDLVQIVHFLTGETDDFTIEKPEPIDIQIGERTLHYDGIKAQNTSTASGKGIPDPFIFYTSDFSDKQTVETPEDWVARADEISCMYEYYMYGKWRDGSDDEVTYEIKGNNMTIHIKRKSTGKTASFPANINLPKEVRHEGGAPVIIGMHNNIAESTATSRGYAVITIGGTILSNPVADDSTAHKGPFYTLYPYGNSWEEQTGVLMAWSWGCSKILDALYNGAAQELNINPENAIVTGVSRWGKATAVCGAFDRRFKMVAPSCSGAGGLALYRYMSKGKTYDFSSKGGSSRYTYGDNEPLGSLQSSGERGWFNDRFLQFRSGEDFPLDQHMLGSLVADPNRYLFIIGSCQDEDWVNAPSMWCSYLGMRHVWDFLGISDHLAINIHKSGHAVIEEDVKYMCAYFDYHVYGIEPPMDLSALQTSVFDLPQNKDPFFDTFEDNWLH